MAAGFLTIFDLQKDQKQDKNWMVLVVSPGQYHIISDWCTHDEAESRARTVATERKLAYVGPDERLVTVYPIANCYVAAYQNMARYRDSAYNNSMNNNNDSNDSNSNKSDDENDRLDLGPVIGAGIAQEDFWTVYEEAERLAKKQQLAFVPLLFSPLLTHCGYQKKQDK